MTKEKYFEMCALLGEEPLEEEIPVDINDLPVLVQQCFSVYHILEDKWDSMGGGYLGKNYTNIFDLFKLYHIEKVESLLAIEFLQHMDGVRSKLVADKLKTKTPATK